MHLMDIVQAKLELFRLEKRYTQRRNRRSAYVSSAQYVDGEYVFQTPSSTSYTAKCVGGASAIEVDEKGRQPRRTESRTSYRSPSRKTSAADDEPNKKLSRRLSKMGLDWRRHSSIKESTVHVKEFDNPSSVWESQSGRDHNGQPNVDDIKWNAGVRA